VSGSAPRGTAARTVLAMALALGLALAAQATAARAGAPIVHRLSSERIAEIARGFAQQQLGPHGTMLELELAAAPRELVLPEGQLDVQTSLQTGSVASGFLTVLVEATSMDGRGTRATRSATVAFRVTGDQPVLVAVRELTRGSAVTAADLRVERRPLERLPRHALADPREAIGKEVVRAVAAGEAIGAASVTAPRVLRRGSPVTLLLEGPGFRIAARGTASEDGIVGQTIKVVNQSSRREMSGRVEDERTVRVPF
jgi:flagella basal body P-ring formation protein FlgA